MLQQQNNQLLASPLGAFSNIQWPFQQQQMHPLDVAGRSNSSERAGDSPIE